ncbi:hypothetical protein BN1708_020366, partial [Verticillium longisporum]
YPSRWHFRRLPRGRSRRHDHRG